MMTPDVTTDQERRCGSVLPVVRIHRKTESGALTMTPDVMTDQERRRKTMAFVRWRGQCAQLLTTIYDQGRSRQLLLANFQTGSYASQWIQEDVALRFPHISVDWVQVNRALAMGPPGSPPLSAQQWECSAVEQALRQFALDPALFPHEVNDLKIAAQTLTNWRARQSRPVP